MKFDNVTYLRCKSVLEARDRAQNPAFKALWNKVFDKLFMNSI
jgi:hypothetical protein